jgi:thiamine biosynthesis lipoprotein
MRRSRENGPAARPLSRRDLFRPRPRAGSDSVSTESASTYDLIAASRPAMGSTFEVRLPVQIPGAADLATRALDLVEDLEAQLTVYNDESEVARINAEAHLGPIPVEPGLFALFERAVDLWRETGGAYDVASGALSLAWGFTRGPRRVPDAATLADARARTGSQHLRLDPEKGTIAFDRPGVVINLGSIGKGYAIDRAADLIRAYWFPSPAIVHGGRSSLYALGSPPDQFGGRWSVALHNPLDPETPVGTIRLRNRGMGTSGASFQRFEEGGRIYGHLIDPRTGEPPEDGPLSVTVLAPTAAEADALSTAFYLLGPGAAASYVEDHPGVGVLFLLRGTSPARPLVKAFGMTDADFVPAARPAS